MRDKHERGKETDLRTYISLWDTDDVGSNVRIHQGTAFTIFTGTGTLYKSGDSVSDVVDIIPAPAENCG